MLDGVPQIGLDAEGVRRIAEDELAKASVRDLPILAARGASGATTVAATAHLAAMAGIRVFATGGLGGVHRGASTTFDESADLATLAVTPITVVSAGVKSVLDIGATLERLESLSVPVIGFGTRVFPSFWLHESAHLLDWMVETPREVAEIMRAQDELGHGQGIVVANAIPREQQWDPAEHDRVLEEAFVAAEEAGVRGKAVTPFLLSYIVTASEGRSLEVNLDLARNNVRVAGPHRHRVVEPEMTDQPPRIVVFGDVIDDIIATPSGAIRADTDTPASIQRRGGGSAANMATWLATLGVAVDFVGRVGVLDLERHSRVLRDAGVRPMLAADHELPTGTIVILVEGDKRSMLTERGANAGVDPESVSDAILDGAAALHFTGYSLFARSETAGFTRLIKRARSRGAHVSVDAGSAGFLADFGPKRFLDAIAGADLLFPSLDEGRQLTGLDEPRAIAERLAKKFPVVALTLGSAGVVVAGSGETVELDVVPVPIVDPTGAGDAFCAGFLDEWIRSRDRLAAARAGAALAGQAVTIVGGRPSV